MSWPIALSNELSILTTTVMLLWVGRLIGESGLVAESAFRQFGSLIIWVFTSTAVGSSVLVSRSVGAADGKGLSTAAGSMTLTFALWVIVAVIALPLSPWIAGLLAGDLPIEGQMLHFVIGWILVALPGHTIAEVLLEVANATGATKFNLVRVLIDLGFMAALTPILMVPVGLGIAGGPVSEGLAALGMVVLVWVALVRSRAELALGELEPGAWRVRWALWKEIIAIGLPMQVGRIAMFVAQIILVRLVMRDGEASVAGYGIAGALLLIGGSATHGFAQGGAILIGQSLGAGLRDRARRAVRTTLLTGWLVIAVFIVATMFAGPLIGLFTSEPDVAAAAAHALSILRWAGIGIACWQILLASFAAHRTTLRANILMIAGETCGVAVALLWSGPYLDAVCIGFVAGNGLKALLLLGLVARGTLATARKASPATPTGLDQGA